MKTRCRAVLLIALLAATPALGLENVDNVHWFFGKVDFETNRVSYVSFDANLTPTDLSAGLTFTIVEWDETGLPATPIWRCILDEFPNLPPVGTRVHVTVTTTYSCDPDGRLVPFVMGTWVHYCGGEYGSAGQYVAGVGRGFVGSDFPVEEYEFALLDEHGNTAPVSTPENAFTPCEGSPGGQPELQPDLLKELGLAQISQPRSPRKPGDSGSVGIYFDREGTICSGTIEPGVPQTIYVIAKTQGLTECGIAGAEFRFVGIPDSWQVSPVPDPDILSFGNPLAEGTTLAMPCRQPEDGRTILYEVEVLASKLEEDVTFRLAPHTDPSGDFGCSLLALCDFPVFTQVCVESIPCHFNASSAKSCDGTVAVWRETWSTVKQLYR